MKVGLLLRSGNAPVLLFCFLMWKIFITLIFCVTIPQEDSGALT